MRHVPGQRLATIVIDHRRIRQGSSANAIAAVTQVEKENSGMAVSARIKGRNSFAARPLSSV